MFKLRLAGMRTDTTNWKTGGARNVLIAVFTGAALFLFFVVFPAVHQAREAARRTSCKCRLKQLGLALHNYHDTYGVFPPAYTVDAEGKPLHSWRTLILPYIDQAALYAQIDLSKPWDDPSNAEAFKTPVSTYCCPSSQAPEGNTPYLAVVTLNSILRPEQSLTIKEVTDGTSNTIVVIEVPADQAVPWMFPQEADEALILSNFTSKNRKLQHAGGLHCLLADGTVRFLKQTITPATLKALLSATGNEQVGEF